MSFLEFLDSTVALDRALSGTYEPFRVALSVLIACLGSYSSFAFSERIRATNTLFHKLGWLVSGALAMGSGVWTMHFVGMLAFALPVEVSYDLPITILSMAPATFAAFVMLYVVSQPKMDWWRLSVGGTFMGAGVGAMHYLGMAAMQMNAIIRYDAVLFAFSIVAAVVLSITALFVKSFADRSNHASAIDWRHVAAAVTMGLAITTVHYTAMAATYFLPDAGVQLDVNALDSAYLTISVGSVATAIIAVLFAATAIGRQLEAGAWLVKAQADLMDAIESIPLGFVLFDSNDRLVLCNNRYRSRHPGQPEVAVPGASFEEIFQAAIDAGAFHAAMGDTQSILEQRLKYHNNVPSSHVQQLADGRWARIEEHPTHDGGVVLLRTDITDRKRSEQALRDSEERFRDIAESAGDWIWEMGPDLRFSYLSDRFFELFPVTAEQVIGKTREEFSGNRSGDERWQKHLRDLAGHRPFRDFEYVATMSNDAAKHIRISGKPLIDGDGAFSGYRGTGADVTAEKQAQAQAIKAQTELSEAIETISDGFVIFDDEGRLAMANRVFQAMHADMATELTPGTPYEDFLHAWASRQQSLPEGVSPEQYVPEQVRRLFDEGTSNEERQTKGRWLYVKERKTETGGIVGVWSDITQFKEMQQSLEKMAHHDSLTGLPNRILFKDRLDRAVAQAKRLDAAIAFIYLDLDGFKPINDSLGHDAGDMVLQEVARRLTTCVRETDTVARMGGDEFAIIMAPPTTREASERMANRMLESLAAPINVNGHTCTVGASIGISVYPDDTEDVDTLAKFADAAMYEVKESGRNGIRFYGK